VEVALKMAYQYWVNQGESGRTLFLSFEGAYHGDTFGAMSVAAHCGFHDAFSKLFFKTLSLPFPSTWKDDPEIAHKEQAVLDHLDHILAEQGSQIAALILEPLIQGAAGMRMCRPEFVKTLVERVRAQGILVIFDEVMTGFGRTGTVFALDQVGLAPDLLCVSKGITGGFLPLALTVTTETMYQAFLSPEWPKAFAHGHSYTANPLACAAALASLKILNQPETGLAMQHIHEAHQAGIAAVKEHCPKAYQHRSLGTIAAFEVHTQDIPRLNRQLKAQFLEAGLLIRPLGNTVYLLPPYCISNTQLQESYHAMIKILNQTI
jgi:adenosylmethionine-8-amino-7-oxononanoate aminotransferase